MFSEFTWNTYLIKDILFIIGIIVTVILALFIEKRKINGRPIFYHILPALNPHAINGARIGILINIVIVISVLFITNGKFFMGKGYYCIVAIFILIPVLFAIAGYLYGKKIEFQKSKEK